jgi:hypothetical protein
MTAKEKLLSRAPIGARSRPSALSVRRENDDDAYDWGDLSKLHEVSTTEAMRRLAEEEQAAGHEPW